LDHLGRLNGLSCSDRFPRGRLLEGGHRAILSLLAHVHVLHNAPKVRVA